MAVKPEQVEEDKRKQEEDWEECHSADQQGEVYENPQMGHIQFQ